MTNLDSIFKSRDITFPTKVRLVKAMVFPVVMYGCVSWTVKKAEHHTIDAFGLWCWRRLFWECLGLQGDSTNPFKGDWSWVSFGRNGTKAETPVLWPPHVKSWLIGKDSDAGGIGGRRKRGRRGWDGWMASLTRWTWVLVNSGSWWWTGRPGVLQFMGSQKVRHDWTTELNWTEGDKITIHRKL